MAEDRAYLAETLSRLCLLLLKTLIEWSLPKR